MVEMVYRQEKGDREYNETGIRLPKNIKQIGDGSGDVQVYMEDNVSLYLSKVPDGEDDIRYGVLLGTVKKSGGYTYIFINGAADVREVFDNTVLFGDDVWTGLNEDIFRYFKGYTVVGWFLSRNGNNVNQNIWIKKIHLNNFAGMDKVFYKIDREENEEAFYRYGKEQLEKMSCYHIYYEKNPEMVRYIEEVGDDMHFKRNGRSEAGSGIIARTAEKKAEKIKNAVNGRTGEEITEENEKENIEKPDRKAERKIEKQTNEKPNNKPDIVKYGISLKKAASVLVIFALAGTLAVMGKKGQLDNLADGFTNIVDNIMHGKDEAAGGSGIISVNGVPSSGNENEIAETDETQTGIEEEDNTSDNVEETNTSDDAAAVGADVEGNTGIPNETMSDDKKEDETALSGQSSTQTMTDNKNEEEAAVQISPASTQTYPVEKGETLYSICMKLYGNTSNMDTIIELNNLESADDIYYGKNLIVP